MTKVATNIKGNLFADMKLPVKIGLGFGMMVLLLVMLIRLISGILVKDFNLMGMETG